MKYARRGATVAVDGAAARYTVRVALKGDKIEVRQRTRERRGRLHTDAAIVARVGVVLDRIARAAADPVHKAELERRGALVKQFSAERLRIEQLVGDAARALLRRVREGAASAITFDAALAPYKAELEAFLPLAEDYARIEILVEELDDGVRRMRADNETYLARYSLALVEILLAGWSPRLDPVRDAAGNPTGETRPAPLDLPPFRLADGRVPEDLLEAIPDEDIRAIADAAAEAMSPTEAERKNSASPSDTSSGGDPSTGSSIGRPSLPRPSTPTETPLTGS